MKLLDETEIILLDNLCEIESRKINIMYKISKEMGDDAFQMAYDSFERYLFEKDGEFVHGMHMEWRYFLTNMLLLKNTMCK